MVLAIMFKSLLANFSLFNFAIFFSDTFLNIGAEIWGSWPMILRPKFVPHQRKQNILLKKKNKLQRIASIQRVISLLCVFCNLLFKQGEGVKCVGVCTNVSLTWISGLCEVVLVSVRGPSRSFIDLGESLLRWRTNGSFIARVFVNNPKTNTTWR